MAMQNLVACVVGLSNNTKEHFATRPGIGKSCLCFRFAYPGYDEYIDTHPSLLALHEFESSVINSAHFLYWGSPLKEYPVKGGGVQVQYHLLEQTVLYQDVTSYPFNPMVRPDDINYYIKRIAGSIESPGKHSYYTRDDIGPSDRYTKFQYPVHLTKQARGYVVVFDVSLTDKDMDMQCKRVIPILEYLCKMKKKPVVLAATKRDAYKIMSMEKARDIQRKFHIPLVETSASENLNVDEVFRVLAKLVLGKKVHRLSDQVVSYDEAARYSLHQRGAAKRSLKLYLEKKCTMYIERLDSIQRTEEYKECAHLIGDFQACYLFVQNQFRLYDEKVDTFDGVEADPMIRQEFLEDFLESRSDFKAYKKELRLWISNHIERCQAAQPPPLPPPPATLETTQDVAANVPPEPYHVFQSKSKMAQEAAEETGIPVEQEEAWSLVNSEPQLAYEENDEGTKISSESSDDGHEYLNYDPKNPLLIPGFLTEGSTSTSLPPTLSSSAGEPPNSVQTPPEQALSTPEQVNTSPKQAPSIEQAPSVSEQAPSVQTFPTTSEAEESASQEDDFHDYENFDPHQLPQLNSAGGDREHLATDTIASQPSEGLSSVKEPSEEQEQPSEEQSPLQLPSDGQPLVEQPPGPPSVEGPPPSVEGPPPSVEGPPPSVEGPSPSLVEGRSRSLERPPPLVLPKPRKRSAPSMYTRNGFPDIPPDLTSESPKLSQEVGEVTPTQAKAGWGCHSIKLRAMLLEGVMKGGEVEGEREPDAGGSSVSESEPGNPAIDSKAGRRQPSSDRKVPDSQFSGGEPGSPVTHSNTEPPALSPVKKHSRVAPPPPVSDGKRKLRSPDHTHHKSSSTKKTMPQTGSTSSSGSASPVLSPLHRENPPQRAAPVTTLTATMGTEDNEEWNLHPKLNMIKRLIAEKKALSPPSETEDKASRIDEIKRKLAENKRRKSTHEAALAGAEATPLLPPASDGNTSNGETPPIPSRMPERSRGPAPKPAAQSLSKDGQAATFVIMDSKDSNDFPKTLVSLRKKIAQRSQPDNQADVKEEKPAKKFGLFSRSTKETTSPSPKGQSSNNQQQKDSKKNTKKSPVKSISLEGIASSRARFLNTSPKGQPSNTKKNIKKSPVKSISLEGIASSRARFLNMKIRPLPPLPGDPDATPDHTEADYELFTHDDMYVNYPAYPSDLASMSMGHTPKKGSSVRRWSSFGSKDKHTVDKTFDEDRALPPRAGDHTLPLRAGDQHHTLPPPRGSIPSVDSSLPDSTRTPTGDGGIPDYIDGYVNPDAAFSPTRRGIDRRPLPEIPIVQPREPEREDENEGKDNDYSYPDIHGALMFRSTQSTKMWMAKMRQKIRQESLPSSVATLLCDGAKERLTSLNDNYLNRCRTISNASSDYVPMNGAQDDTYVNYSSMSTRQPVLANSLPPRSQLKPPTTSTSTAAAAAAAQPAEPHSPEPHPPTDGEKQCAVDDLTVYMNLPMPEKTIPLSSRHVHAMTLPRSAHLTTAPPPVAARPKAAGINSSPVKKVPPPTKPRSVTVNQISALDRDTTLPLDWTTPQSSTPPIIESEYQNFDIIDQKPPPIANPRSLEGRRVSDGLSQLPPRHIKRQIMK